MLKSRFLAALAMFTTVNLVILVWCGDQPLSMLLPSSLTAFKERFYSQSSSPDVVLLGSSIMRRPFFACDQKIFGYKDYGNYSEARDLQAKLSSPAQRITIFNAARDGAMVTDTLLIEEKLLKGPFRPKLLVYGIAPRDFIDSLLESEQSTDIFKYFFGLTDAIKFGDLFTRDYFEKLTLTASQAIPLHGCRQSIQFEIGELLHQNTVAKRIRSAQQAQGEEEKITAMVATIMRNNASNREATKQILLQQTRNGAIISNSRNESLDWRMSLWEYSLRYLYPTPQRFKHQTQALKNVLVLAKNRGIKIVVVNMPLSYVNLNLLPDGFYGRYLDAVKETCEEEKITFVDLQKNNQFNRDSFADIAHMNYSGGVTLTALLAPIILQELKK